MAKTARPANPDTLLTSRRSYASWAKSVANLAKTPRSLLKPRKELTDLEFVAAVLPESRRDLIELWEAFTLNRSEVSRYLMDPKKEALVYLLGFHLPNVARTQGMLRRAEHRLGLISWLQQKSKALHLEDLGAGTGALSAATLDLIFRDEEKLPCSVELVDKSQAFLDAAALTLKAIKPDLELVSRRQRLDEFLSHESRKQNQMQDTVVWHQLGYVWNEIAHNPKTVQSLLKHLDSSLKHGQRLITLLEPASQDQSRGAMQLREELCQMGYQILYPCSHSDACPMLERTRDWCYSEWQWQEPPLMQKVDRILEIDRQRIGATAFLFASPDIVTALRAAKQRENAGEAIVVGRPAEQKAAPSKYRKFSYLLCSAEGLDKVPSDAGAERLRGVVWQKFEKPVITPIKGAAELGIKPVKKTKTSPLKAVTKTGAKHKKKKTSKAKTAR